MSQLYSGHMYHMVLHVPGTAAVRVKVSQLSLLSNYNLSTAELFTESLFAFRSALYLHYSLFCRVVTYRTIVHVKFAECHHLVGVICNPPVRHARTGGDHCAGNYLQWKFVIAVSLFNITAQTALQAAP